MVNDTGEDHKGGTTSMSSSFTVRAQARAVNHHRRECSRGSREFSTVQPCL